GRVLCVPSSNPELRPLVPQSRKLPIEGITHEGQRRDSARRVVCGPGRTPGLRLAGIFAMVLVQSRNQRTIILISIVGFEVRSHKALLKTVLTASVFWFIRP